MYSIIYVCIALTTVQCQVISILTEKQPLPVTLNGTIVKGFGVVGHKQGRINKKGILKKGLSTSNEMLDKKSISIDPSEKTRSSKLHWLKHSHKTEKTVKKKKTTKQPIPTTSRQAYDDDTKRVPTKQRFWKTKWFKNPTSTANEQKSETVIQPEYFSVGTCLSRQPVANFNGPDLEDGRRVFVYRSNGLQKGDGDERGRITTYSNLVKTTRVEDQVSDAFSYSCRPFTQAEIARPTNSPTLKMKKSSWSCRPPTDIPITQSPRPSRMKSTIARCVLTMQTCKPVTYADPGTKWFVKVTSVDPWVRDKTTESEESLQ